MQSLIELDSGHLGGQGKVGNVDRFSKLGKTPHRHRAL